MFTYSKKEIKTFEMLLAGSINVIIKHLKHHTRLLGNFSTSFDMLQIRTPISYFPMIIDALNNVGILNATDEFCKNMIAWMGTFNCLDGQIFLLCEFSCRFQNIWDKEDMSEYFA